jgi:hypothetical protein
VTFEFLEYSLEHQLANFSECWWDHWILDVLICNGGGTIVGIYTLRWLSIKVRFTFGGTCDSFCLITTYTLVDRELGM